ncbi:Sec-independent protein translocase protein TatB [Saccharospirillum salsuginis]|uniref:Sec-independent protein translocase protein TatB n=1 Tax=Saccharospirillum salsuginis TaxID=418750 RepID=A0A918K343_9GAMM|nr:Sec-independent protein translocase protein TatB [Saccharospirillum salsuginis]GGX47285.1 Sec-independent protein translocase protein TatB [Saccharospirillum salsuginis]
MFDIGFTELLVLAIIGIVVIGPERLPGVARTIGRALGQVRRTMSNFQNQLEQEVKLDELNKKIMAETKGQTFRNNDEPAPASHDSEDAEVPSTPPESESKMTDTSKPADPSAATETAHENADNDEVRKP